jgi:hypothetical protein
MGTEEHPERLAGEINKHQGYGISQLIRKVNIR